MDLVCLACVTCILAIMASANDINAWLELRIITGGIYKTEMKEFTSIVIHMEGVLHMFTKVEAERRKQRFYI